MDTQKCKYLMSIAEHQSFSRAAEAMFVTQPYLSRVVQEIEQNLGAKLFRREKNRVTLTRAGEFYLDYCKNLVLMEDNIRSEMRNFSENRKGRIRIGMSPANGSYILPQALTEFQGAYPDIQVIVDDGDDQAMLNKTLEGSLDITFFCLPEYPNELAYQLIRMEPILLVLPPNHPLGQEDAKGNYEDPPLLTLDTMKRLQFDSFIGLSKSKGIGMYAEDLFRRCGIVPQTRYSFHNIETAFRMAAYGNGYTFIPQTAARFSKFSDPPFFFQISLDTMEIFHRSHVAAYRKNHRLNMAENMLINFIRKYA